MIKSSIFTLGVLTVLGSAVIGGLMIFAGGMSDDIRAGNATASSGLTISGFGIALGIGACVLALMF